MDINGIALIALRVFHSIAAVIWVGGGLYYLIAVRPQSETEFASKAQTRFREWARPATGVMLATGVILLFEGLSSNTAGVTYAAVLAAKIAAALAAFWLVSFRRRSARRLRAEQAVTLGMAAFVLGIIISSIWPSD